MKKLFLLLMIIQFSGFALATPNTDECDIILQKIKLSNNQKAKIAEIKEEYNKQVVLINSQIILTNMQIAQNKLTAALNSKQKMLSQELENLKTERDRDILSQLGFFQRMKYRNLISKWDTNNF